MKNFIEERALKADGTRILRLIYIPLNQTDLVSENVNTKCWICLSMTNPKHGFQDRSKRTVSFIDYFQRQVDIKEQTTSTSNHSIWISARKHLLLYCGKHDLSFDEVDKNWLNGFKYYLINEAKTKSATALSRNIQSSYFNKVRAAIKEAHREGIIRDNPLSQVTSIKAKTTQRVYLTLDEVNTLAQTECRYQVLKKAFCSHVQRVYVGAISIDLLGQK